MSTLSKINAALSTPINEKRTREIDPRAIAIVLQKEDGSFSQQFEAREAMRKLAPLEQAGWSVQPGAVDHRTGVWNEIIVREPVEGIDTATLPLLDRVRVDGDVPRKKTYTRAPRVEGQSGPSPREHTGYETDWLDDVEVNEESRTVVFSSAGAEKHIEMKMQRCAEELRRAGWLVRMTRSFRGNEFTARCIAPEKGRERTRAYIEEKTGK